nr:hypothetical protein CFP56_65574 [Quercus suber]
MKGYTSAQLPVQYHFWAMISCNINNRLHQASTYSFKYYRKSKITQKDKLYLGSKQEEEEEEKNKDKPRDFFLLF